MWLNMNALKSREHRSSNKLISQMKEAFVLVGPLAAGKSHIGKLIERDFGIPFFEYEDIFIKEQRKNPVGYLSRAEPTAEVAILNFLNREGRICFENTMARPYALEILNEIQQIADVRIIYVHTSFELALKRLQRREKSTHVSWSQEEVKDIYRRSESLSLDYDLVLHNDNLSDEQMLCYLRRLVEERKWQQAHVEISFRNQVLKFNSWSGQSLTPYDMEYRPWRTAFRKENVGYLQHYSLKSGDIVIDAGAYEGTFTIYAAKAVGKDGLVIAFEPDSENYRRLRENIDLNELKNVIVVNKALWERKAILKFNDKHTAGASFFFNASSHINEIEVVSLDEELGRLGIRKVDFIKMDVEGSEVKVLEGARNTLAGSNVSLAIATYHIVNEEETCEEVEVKLRGLGYDAVTAFPEHKTTYAKPR